MKRVFKKTHIFQLLCVLLLAMMILAPKVAEAASLTVSSGTTKNYTAAAGGETISVSLSGAYTSVSLMGKPTWVTQSGSGSSRTITIQKNTSSSSRSGDIVYRDGTKVYTLRITQNGAAAQKVVVSFNVNGGSGTIPKSTYTVGKTYGSLPAGPTPATGKSFAGWYTAASGGTRIYTSSTVSASYTTLYAHYTTNSYTISFNSNGGSSVASKTVSYGSTYGSLTTPSRSYYTFDGWYTAESGGTRVYSSTTMNKAYNHTLYAHWTRQTITVSFNNNGGYGSIPKQTYNLGGTYGSLPAGPTPPTGKSFAGWYTSGGTRIYTSSTVSSSYTTLYAHYTANSYTVSFNSDGGSSVSNKTVTYGNTYGTLTSPTKTGYNFSGWFTAASGGTQVTAAMTMATAANHTLYARWTPKTFTISFNSQGGSSVAQKAVTYNNSYGTLPNPTKTGYTFQGWFSAASGGSKITASTKVTITANQTLYAQWKGASITVKFDNNGGYGNVPSQTYVVDSTYGKLPAGSTPPTGYAFAGWYTAKSGGIKITTSTKVSPSYMTLYAHYSPKNFTVSFNSQLGSSVKDQTVTYNSTYGTLPTPTRTGYNFDGWYTAAGGGTKVTASTKVTTAANHTLYAHWVAKNFTITFNSMGGSAVSSKTVKYNSSYGTLTTPTRTGYDFQGWYTAAAGGTKITASTKVTITANQTLFAQWKGKSITVKFDNNGGYGNVPSQTYTVDSTYGSLPAGSTPPVGYAFDGWYTAKSGGTKITTTTKVSPTYMILYAHYTPKSFTVTFNSQGGSSVAQKKVTYDSTYGSLTSPTKTGYTFVGWYTAASGGAKVTSTSKVTATVDHTLYAHWTAKTYIVTFDSLGGSSVDKKTVTYNSNYGTLTSPTKNGYIFQGWYTAASTGIKVSPTTKVTLAASHTLYAHWKGAPITVKFDNNGGYGSIPAQTYTVEEKYGNLPTGSTPPAGYTFAGWYTAKTGGVKITKNALVSPSVKVLYAHYTANSINISFDSRGGTKVDPKKVTYGNTYGSMTAPTRSGYTFNGWYTAANGGTQVGPSTKVTTTIAQTLYAHWTPKTYKISFYSNGGPSVPSQTVTYDSTYGTLPKPNRKDYEFIGWYTAIIDGDRILPTTKVTITSDKTLYAHWKAKEVVVSFDTNGGYGTIPKKTYIAGDKYGSLPPGPTPSKKNQKFNGWYNARSGGIKITSNSVVSSSYTTLYAQYVNDTNAFFTANPRFKPANNAKTEPYNSAVEAAKGVTMDQYVTLFTNHSPLYDKKNLGGRLYALDILDRSKLTLAAAAAGRFTITPEASELLFRYLGAKGEKYVYDGTNYALDFSVGTGEYNKVANNLMRQMEKYLGKGQKITFVDKNAAANRISFTDAGFDDLNGFLGVKEGSTGVSGSCTFDGSVYKMDLYFYIQDYYDFYYEDDDPNSQSDFQLGLIYMDELAFLVPFNLAKPYETTAVFHTCIEWYEGQSHNIVAPYPILQESQSEAKVTIYDFGE